MRRAIIAGFILLMFMSEASARMHDQGSFQKWLLSDLVDIRSRRYYAGQLFSRFPRKERRLQILPYGDRHPLDMLYEQARIYRVQPNDTLGKIALAHGVTIELIKELNRMKRDLVRIGQKLWIPESSFTMEINKTLNRLYLKSEGILIKEYPVSTGRSAAQTPEGVFFINSRFPYPTWFHKGVVVPGTDPDNYLGSRWLGLDEPQFGIHGTIFPEQIGQSVSKGCVRMKNEDVEELYEFIPIGTRVIITEI